MYIIPKEGGLNLGFCLLKHNSWEVSLRSYCGHIFPTVKIYCKKRHFPYATVPWPLVLNLHRGWVKNFVVKVTLFLLALVNVWNFTQATLRGDDRMIFVWKGQTFKQLLAGNCRFEAFFYCSWKCAAKLKKSATPWGGPMLQVPGLWFSNLSIQILRDFTILLTHMPNVVFFPTESIFTLNELVSYACGLRKPTAARSSDGRNSFWSHLAWWCAHQGSLEVVWEREVLPRGLTNKFRCFFEQERLKEVAICWCCWWSLLNMTDSFFSHRPVLLRS